MLYPDVLTELDPDSREWIRSNQPPATVEEALTSAWKSLVLWYGDEQKGEHRAALRVFDGFAQGYTVEEIWTMYGTWGSETPEAVWSDEVQAQMNDLVLNPDDEDIQANRQASVDRWEQEVADVAAETYAAFLGEVALAKTGGDEDDDVDDLTADYTHIDWGDVQAANETILKGTDPGDDIPFMQADDGRLTLWGEGADVSVWNAFLVKQAAGSADLGNISVKSRGSLTSRGKIVVTGATDPAAFKRLLRQFSKKEIEFK
jgi:hypothetical protein